MVKIDKKFVVTFEKGMDVTGSKTFNLKSPAMRFAKAKVKKGFAVRLDEIRADGFRKKIFGRGKTKNPYSRAANDINSMF